MRNPVRQGRQPQAVCVCRPRIPKSLWQNLELSEGSSLERKSGLAKTIFTFRYLSIPVTKHLRELTSKEKRFQGLLTVSHQPHCC